MLPTNAESYWMATTEAADYPTMPDGLDVDVAVVGAGIAGICTAWELQRAGHSVVLIDAHRIAAGVSGYTTAKVTAQHTLIYAHLRSAFGIDAARQYARSQMDAIGHVLHTVETLGIDCDLERRPAFTYAESADELGKVRDEVDAAQQAGLAATFVTRTQLPFEVAGAIEVADQAQFHPRKYLLALAADFVDHGGQIYERSRVLSLDEGKPCRLTTEDGSQVSAGSVVVATHYPVFDRALMFSRLVPKREWVVAGPIPADADPDGMYITEGHGNRSVRTAPLDQHRRLLIVTGESFAVGSADVALRRDRLAAWAQEHFPLESLTYGWATQDNTTADRVPYVGPFHLGSVRTYVATGFGGWGMTNGVMAAKLLAAEISDQERPEWAKLYDPRRLHPTVEAAALIKAQFEVGKHFVGDRLKPSTVGGIAELPSGRGALIRVGGERNAVYRDHDGLLHAVSSRCTHLGCLVAFNDAEASWDCPCHGSRFSIDGSVLQGPATKPLQRRTLPED